MKTNNKITTNIKNTIFALIIQFKHILPFTFKAFCFVTVNKPRPLSHLNQEERMALVKLLWFTTVSFPRLLKFNVKDFSVSTR